MVGKKFRVQLDFQEVDFQILNEKVTELGLSSRAELFRSGLRTLFWLLEKKRQGCTVAAVTPNGRHLEPEFDFLAKLSAAGFPRQEGDSSPTQ
jgi:hypothetical protein